MKTTIMILWVVAMSAVSSVAQAHDSRRHHQHRHYYRGGHHAPVVRYYSEPYCRPYYYGGPTRYYPQPYCYPRSGFVLRLGW